MTMKTTINRHEFFDAFQALRPENFSREAISMLFEHLEEYETETGTELDFDVIAICCDFCEQDAREVNDEYSLDLDLSDTDEHEAADMVAEALQEQTSVVGVTGAGAVVFQVF
jgi:hypothetical protein